ncbi:hypothetical protein [Erythrobacter litoralis]|uniref:Uncharacterized protein n=1 Tax=Erythrobacter litoralis (strain HTCC2594) TaxID=314225 RepID=Q2NB59_ERYLH|nr:hypothetical protein [Erythrobacter litoralis]ABC63082.1 hypothetical protein ELI_04950 [Erythrobacter litoralis HTCC2594]
MAKKGTAFFDNKGQFFRTPEEASLSDLAALLGKIGDGESLAPGIAFMLLDKRKEIEAIFNEHDEMKREEAEAVKASLEAANVTELPSARPPKVG